MFEFCVVFSVLDAAYEAKADGKAVAKGDFAKTQTDTYTNVGLFYPKSSSKSSAVSVSG